MGSIKAIEAKQEQVNELAERIKNSKLFLVVDFKGTTVESDTKLRKELRETNAVKTVKKNNIVKRALEANNETGLNDVLVGTTAIITSEEDYLAPLKKVYNFTKSNENYKIKGGIIEGKVMTSEELLTLAKLPSREELLSKLAGALLGTISKFAVAIDQVRMKKEAENA